MKRGERKKGINVVKTLIMVKPSVELKGIFIKILSFMLNNFHDNKSYMIMI